MAAYPTEASGAKAICWTRCGLGGGFPFCSRDLEVEPGPGIPAVRAVGQKAGRRLSPVRAGGDEDRSVGRGRQRREPRCRGKVVGGQGPVQTRIGRAVESDIGSREDAPRLGRVDQDGGDEGSVRDSVPRGLPGLSAVSRLVERLSSRVESPRIGRIHRERVDLGTLQPFAGRLPAPSGVGGSEDACGSGRGIGDSGMLTVQQERGNLAQVCQICRGIPAPWGPLPCLKTPAS